MRERFIYSLSQPHNIIETRDIYTYTEGVSKCATHLRRHLRLHKAWMNREVELALSVNSIRVSVYLYVRLSVSILIKIVMNRSK